MSKSVQFAKMLQYKFLLIQTSLPQIDTNEKRFKLFKTVQVFQDQAKIAIHNGVQ